VKWHWLNHLKVKRNEIKQNGIKVVEIG